MSAALRAKLEARAALLKSLRAFFAERDVLEVETPLLCTAPASDPNIDSFKVEGRWLQSSPEYAMKRLLCESSGAIYQIGKAFRKGEAGKRHNPEFTMLEWYRPGFTLNELIAETCELLARTLSPRPVELLTYDEALDRYCGVDSQAPLSSLKRAGDFAFESNDPKDWLDFLLSTKVEPNLGKNRFTVITQWPADQAALSKVLDGKAQRFEVYVDGLELANGYDELLDAAEFQRRWQIDNQRRSQTNKVSVPADEALIAALENPGLPACCGVALGVDRLLMLRTHDFDIRNNLPQHWQAC